MELIRYGMPSSIRMNMFFIDCGELNDTLMAKCEQLVMMLLEKIGKMVYSDKANQICKEVRDMQESLTIRAENSAALVKF